MGRRPDAALDLLHLQGACHPRSFAGIAIRPPRLRRLGRNATKLYDLVEQQGFNTKVVLTGDVQVAMGHRGGAAKERSAAAQRPAAQYAQRAYYPRAAPNSYYPGTYQPYYSYQPYRYGY
jgi:hypothetical protein